MDSLRLEMASHHLPRPRSANLAGPNAVEVGNDFTPAVAPVTISMPLPFFSIAGATSCAAINAPNALTRQVFSNVARLGIHQLTERPHRGVVEQRVHFAKFAPNLVERRCYVRGFRDLRRHRQRLAAFGFDCACDSCELVLAPRHQRYRKFADGPNARVSRSLRENREPRTIERLSV